MGHLFRLLLMYEGSGRRTFRALHKLLLAAPVDAYFIKQVLHGFFFLS